MKNIIFKKNILAACLVVTLAWSNTAYSIVLDVPQKMQEKTEWCWAGTSQAILEYYATINSQTQIAQYGTNGVNTWNWIIGSDVQNGQVRNGVNLILARFGALSTIPYYTSLSQARVQTEINARRPFVIRWGWDSGGGHILVGKGVEGSVVHLMDPWYGPTINSYSWVVRGSSHAWTHSLTNTRSGPLPQVDEPDKPFVLIPIYSLLLK